MDHSIEKGETPKPVIKKRKSHVIRNIIWILVLGFVIIQFFQSDKNNNSVRGAAHISSLAPVPDTVNRILKVACYDCHSNNTRYPWYTNIQPVGWWLTNHINEGKQHLNFDEFANYTSKKQLKKLEDIKESVGDGSMPISSYTWIHKDAILSTGQREMIKTWADSTSKLIAMLPVKK